MKGKKKLILALAVIFAINSVIISAVQLIPDAAAASYKKGSSGEVVTEIQQRLYDWGYSDGDIDGIYGSRTESAVKAFQQKNGLTADGVAGPATLAAIGLPSGSAGSGVSSGSSDVNLLARLISAEARGEPYVGQVAVGAVVLNRMEHPSFPSTLSGVIYQDGAFSCLDDGQFDEPVAESAYQAARDALNGWDPSGGAIYYYNPAKTSNAWMHSRPVIVTIGSHVFCK